MERPNDKHFDPWCHPVAPVPKAIIDRAITEVEDYEKRQRLRQRARPEAARRSFTTTITAILSDLMRHHSAGLPSTIYVPRSKQVLGRKSRYRPAALGETVPIVLDRLEATGWIDQNLGGRTHYTIKGRRTTIRPGDRLLDAIAETPIIPQHFRSDRREEVIVLGRSKHDFWDSGEAIEYHDTEETTRFRQQVREINDWLDAADIECLGHDDSRRRLRRSFTRGRFDSGGRLFGGFWQGLSKKDRKESLIFGSASAAELDFGQMAPRILYGLAGAPAPIGGDLYSISGFEERRAGIKKVFNAMIFTDSPLTKKPKGTAGHFDPQTTVGDIEGAIMRTHAPIAELFHTGIGHYAQFLESQIMVAVLLRLKRQGVVALPVHDALIVADRHATVAETTMHEVFQDHVGQPGVVSRDF